MELDWNAIGAIGELLGAIAVVGTLVYLSIQIRRNQTEIFSSLASSGQQAEFALRNKLEESSELICKANAGEGLTREEAYRLRQITHMIDGRHFMAYVRIVAMHESTVVVARNMARTLVENPAIFEDWTKYQRQWLKDFDDIEREAPAARSWVDEVNDAVEKLTKKR